jgi:hypothetical protein
MRRIAIAPAATIRHIEAMGCANAHHGHVDMLLILIRCHSIAVLGGKNAKSKHLNNRAIFVRAGTLRLTPQRHDTRRCCESGDRWINRVHSRAAGAARRRPAL